MNIKEKNLIITVDIDTDILLGTINNVSEFIINNDNIYQLDYSEYIPIRVTIEKKYDYREPIILEWFSKPSDIENNGKELISCLRTESRIDNNGSMITKLKYNEDYDNLVINCPLADLFQENLNGMSENNEYDTIIRDSIISSIERNLEEIKEEPKKILIK